MANSRAVNSLSSSIMRSRPSCRAKSVLRQARYYHLKMQCTPKGIARAATREVQAASATTKTVFAYAHRAPKRLPLFCLSYTFLKRPAKSNPFPRCAALSFRRNAHMFDQAGDRIFHYNRVLGWTLSICQTCNEIFLLSWSAPSLGRN